MKGDRVAVLGRGIAVVKRADDIEVHVLLCISPSFSTMPISERLIRVYSCLIFE
jgi:hypothetical protein